MDRRRLILTAGLGMAWVMGGSARAQATETMSDYSESMAMMLFDPDGSRNLLLRLQRHIGAGVTTLWAGYDSASVNYKVVDAALIAKTAAHTPVANDSVVFEATGPWACRFEHNGRNGAHMTGKARMRGHMFPNADPPAGPGPLTATIEMYFDALHAPVLVRPGRMEVFGLGRGRLVLSDRELALSGYAKWHEQVGDRPRFAPAFTYMALSAGETALLAVARGDTGNGFALEQGRTTQVTALRVSPPGDERQFAATLTDGRTITGSARTLRRFSEVIEGKRRPGASVVAQTALGPMVGQINDWDPPP